MPATANLQDRVFKLVRTILDKNSIDIELLPRTRLVEMGLNSMDMVNLMLRIEAEFDLELPQSEITPDNFQSVEGIERMIAKQMQS
jgi:acyl carrier protein